MPDPTQKTQRNFLLGTLVGVALSFGVLFASRHFAEAGAPPASGEQPDRFAGEPSPYDVTDVVAALKQGGRILYFRHGNRQKWDSVIAFDVYELATGTDSANSSYKDAVCLSAQGEEEARMIGKILKLARVEVGKVVASPSCRAQQTARLAFGRIDITSMGLAHTPVTNANDSTAFTTELRHVLTTVPLAAGSNAIVLAHGNTLENNPELFASGTEFLRNPTNLLETGFYVIERHPDGSLGIMHKFLNLGEFAAAAIDLDPVSPIAAEPVSKP